MSVIPIGYAEVVSEFNVPGNSGPALVVFGLANPTDKTAQALADSVWTAWTQANGLLTNLSNVTALIRTRAIYNDAGVEMYGEHTGSVAGAAAGAPLPPNCAYLASKRTGLVGRANQGRMYIPGCTEAEVGNDGIVTPAFIATMQTDLSDFIADLITDGNPMVILHSTVGPSPTDVNALSMNQKIATQRRRMR